MVLHHKSIDLVLSLFHNIVADRDNKSTECIKIQT
jgi:hypothetical protein